MARKTLAQMERELAKAEQLLAARPYVRPSRALRAEVEEAYDNGLATLRQVVAAKARFSPVHGGGVFGFAAAWILAAPPRGQVARYWDVFTIPPGAPVPTQCAEALSEEWQMHLDEVPWSPERDEFFDKRMYFGRAGADNWMHVRQFAFDILMLLGDVQGSVGRKELWVKDGRGWKLKPELEEYAQLWMPHLDTEAEALQNGSGWDRHYRRQTNRTL